MVDSHDFSCEIKLSIEYKLHGVFLHGIAIVTTIHLFSCEYIHRFNISVWHPLSRVLEELRRGRTGFIRYPVECIKCKNVFFRFKQRATYMHKIK